MAELRLYPGSLAPVGAGDLVTLPPMPSKVGTPDNKFAEKETRDGEGAGEFVGLREGFSFKTESTEVWAAC